MENINLKLIGPSSRKYWNVYECFCGNVFETTYYRVNTQHTRSCGCLKSSVLRDRNHLKKGIPTKPKNYRIVTVLIKCIRSGAISRGLSYELTRSQVEEIVQQPCVYCGRSHYKSMMNVDGSEFKMNGIDRKDNSKGYTLENSVSCYKKCNHSKKDMSTEDFLDHCRSVTEFQNKNK